MLTATTKPSNAGHLLTNRWLKLNNRHKLFGHVFDKNHSGDLARGSRNAKDGRIAREELRRLGWVEADLPRRPKNAPAKLALAARLRRE